MTVTLTTLQERAVRLVGHTNLSDTRLFGLNVTHVDFDSDGGDTRLGDISLDLQMSGGDDLERPGLVYVLHVSTTLVEDRDAAGEMTEAPLAELNVAYGALYTVDPDVMPVTPEERHAFGYAVAAMAIWPFVRATIANAVRELGFETQGLLPTMTQADLVEVAAAAAGDAAD